MATAHALPDPSGAAPSQLGTTTPDLRDALQAALLLALAAAPPAGWDPVVWTDLLRRALFLLPSLPATGQAAARVQTLPPRMRPVLALLLEGCAEKEVARRLGKSPHTVHQYVKGIHKHLGVRSRGELLASLLRAG